MTHHPHALRNALVTNDHDLRAAIDAAQAHGSVALDTEFMREKTYAARLCLVQIATTEQIWLVDPMSNLDISPLAELLADPSTEVLVHAGKQDLDIFYERFGVVPRSVFDVQVAASFAGFGASLPYGRLVEQVVGLTLDKGESYTDWCARPLTDAQLRYAADDVRYLHVVADKLKARLAELGRTEWLAEELCEWEREDAYATDERELWRKVTGRGNLNPKQLAVLRELAAWREAEARRRNIPRGWVVKDPTLVDLARRSPSEAGALRSIRGLVAKEVDRSSGPLLAAIRRGRSAEPIQGPSAPPRSAQVKARVVLGLADAVVRGRCERASIASEVVATRGDLEGFLADLFAGRDVSRHRLMTGWRAELAGDAVAALGEGRVGLRVVRDAPFVQEVEVADSDG